MLRRGLKMETILRLTEAIESLDNKANCEARYHHDFLNECTKRYGVSEDSFKQTLYTSGNVHDTEYQFWLVLSDMRRKMVRTQDEFELVLACKQSMHHLRQYYKYYGIDPKSVKSLYGNLSSALLCYFC